jgi:hypothetical protein
MTSDLHDLWRERQQVGAALDSGLLADDDPAWERFPDLDQAVREARPTDPAGLAVQMRLLADQFAASGHVADEKLALRIAAALEKLDQPGQNGTPGRRVDVAEVTSSGIATRARRPRRRLALTRCAGRSARRRFAEQFVVQAAALLWTINIWVVTIRTWWLGRRAAPIREQRQPAHSAAVWRARLAPLSGGPAHAAAAHDH